MIGLIVKNISNIWTVKLDDKLYECKASGKVRNSNLTPLVGDKVIFDEVNSYIKEILPRKSLLTRPNVSNIDQVLIVVSVKDPNLDLYLLDKLLLISEYNNLTPIICFTKLDLLTNLDNVNELKNYYSNLGYLTIDNIDLNKLKSIFKDKITVVTGQSGVGKSSLLNKLDKNINLKTNEISYALGRGKHTTRHTELFYIFDGYIVDTPGFSSIDINVIPSEYIKENIKEIFKYSHNCLYKGCSHIKEVNCYVKKMVSENKILESRYDNYIKFISEGKDKYGKN